MLLLTQRDIVLAPFLFTDASSVKKRPVLVISNDKINLNTSSVNLIGLMITSKIRKRLYSIKLDSGDFEEGCLPKESEIHCDMIATIHKDKIIKKFGKINETTFSCVRDGVEKVLE